MVHKQTHLMLFNKHSVKSYVPNTTGVFYLRGIADEHSLYPVHYIGYAKNIREALIQLCERADFSDAVFVSYQKCDSSFEAKTEAGEQIIRHSPKYNRTPMHVRPIVTVTPFSRTYKWSH